jgi:hypothetical protein
MHVVMHAHCHLHKCMCGVMQAHLHLHQFSSPLCIHMRTLCVQEEYNEMSVILNMTEDDMNALNISRGNQTRLRAAIQKT